MSPKKACPFCDPHVLAEQKFYENEGIVALYSYKPFLPGHCLIVPKKHIERFEDLTDEEIGRIGKAIKQIHPKVVEVFGNRSYLLVQKNGTEVGQTVEHLHFHYIPRRIGEKSTFKMVMQLWRSIYRRPIASAKMKEVVEELKKEFSL